jgi:hypothetical protein
MKGKNLKLSEGTKNSLKNDFYNCVSYKEMCTKYNLKYSTVVGYCGRNNFIRNPDLSSKKGIFQNRLKNFVNNNTHEIWYWYGFMTADGHINEDSFRIAIQKRDEGHLLKLKSLFDFNVGHNINSCYMKIDDKIHIPILKQKLNLISNNKTLNPPDLNQVFQDFKEYFYSFLIGFIDGDGSIELKKGSFSTLKIELHSSWLYNLQFIAKRLEQDLNIKSKVRLNKRGYSVLTFHRLQNILKLKNIININKLPYMERKWDKFRENFLSRKKYNKCILLPEDSH